AHLGCVALRARVRLLRNAPRIRMTISLRKAVMLLLGASFILALVPSGFSLERRLAGDLEARDREDLARAPMILKDRNAQSAEMMSMHAQAMASTEGLGEALARRDLDGAIELVMAVEGFPGEEPVLVGPDGALLIGPDGVPDRAVDPSTRSDSVTFVPATDAPRALALADVMDEIDLVGTAGVSAALDAPVAGTLAGLTRSYVVVVNPEMEVAASTLPEDVARQLAVQSAELAPDTVVDVVTADGERYWMVVARLADAGSVAFIRNVSEELAVLPRLRRTALAAGLLALGLALLGAYFASRILAKPVEGLAAAADRVGRGDFSGKAVSSSFTEVNQVSQAFDGMRRSLADRVQDLEEANQALDDRRRRMEALQTELIQRDRLAANSRLVSELAHEIRNPVANVRNCLEVVRRDQDERGLSTEFTDLAIDELLRMHELAEKMLDTNRPDSTGVEASDIASVVGQIADLYRAGAEDRSWSLLVDLDSSTPQARAQIPPDALKQVLMNLVENAREVTPPKGVVEVAVSVGHAMTSVTVSDRGPGIEPDVMPKIFDPFFTTKGAVTGVGLGLFVAQGVVRRYGGRLSAENREGGGARFTLEMPLEAASVAVD
ncbi:MAG: two-component system NtrC family sensor kinase, partial [Myxococcota bacterium]